YDAALQKIEALARAYSREQLPHRLTPTAGRQCDRGVQVSPKSSCHLPCSQGRGSLFPDAPRQYENEGMLGQEDHEVAWLESVDLSAAQQRDPIYYEPG